MTSTIPACKDCKHYYEEGTIGVIPLCKFHTFERPDYINGRINKIDMIAFDAREKEKYCGREGKNFEQREVPVDPVEVPRVSTGTRLKRLINGVWKYFSRYDVELI